MIYFQMFMLIVVFSSEVLASHVTDGYRGEYTGTISSKSIRQVYRLNRGWHYFADNTNDLDELKTKEGWVPVDLPHTWNSLDATDNDPGYRRSASWYKYELTVPARIPEMLWELYFEGANITSDVFVNGHHAGSHIGGYVGFSIDLTAHLKTGEKNEIHIRVDNSINPDVIPSQKADFFIFGGITRDVWLRVLPKDHISRIHISTPVVAADLAQTEVSLTVVKKSTGEKKIRGEVELQDPVGKTVLTHLFRQNIKKGSNIIRLELPVLRNPQLWSPESPGLYTAHVVIENMDSVSESFGYRWFEFKRHGPFYLNGERLLIRGTHRHEEWAGYGNAMPNELHRRDIRMMKEMGANFVRLAHYPQDPEIYRACDELGLLVWDELPWCRGGMGGDAWRSNTRRLLEEQVNQNYNHPSIILWSLGNELYWLPDFPGGDDPEKLKGFVSELNDLVHEMDPHRLTTVRKFYDGANITDVFSPSIWAGWYSGVYKTYENALNKARETYPFLLHAEYGGSSHVGRHNENPVTGEGTVSENEWDEKPNMVNVKNISREGDWSENYIVDLFDWHLSVSEKLDWFPGNAQWAFRDFGTPLRPENPIPFINQKGLMDRGGNPKDAYYVFKSYWTTDPRFCYIESPTWTTRTGPVNLEREISVYSNCDQVRLALNGLNLERKTKNVADFPATGYHWNVKFTEGPNEVIATGYFKGDSVTSDTLIINYSYIKPGRPARIHLESKTLKTGNMLISAMVVDDEGRLCVDYNDRVYFDLNGSGELKKYLGTPTGSNIIEFASGRAAIEYIPKPGFPGIIEARTQDLKGDYLVLTRGE